MPIKALTQKLTNSLLHLVYPTHCIHCNELLDNSQATILCSSCLTLLELIEPKERCPFCFGKDYSKSLKRCEDCSHGLSIFYRMAAVFEYNGPAVSLLRQFKSNYQSHLSKGLGAFLAVQFDRLNWPKPDAIIPVPLSFIKKIERGYNQSALLAKELACLLQVPVWHAIKRYHGDYSQEGLSLSQRKELKASRFALKKGYHLEDKTLLVVDDLMVTGTTLRCCAEVLVQGYPARLYSLTLCRPTN